MTAYIEGATVAHVMECACAPGQWRSLCGRANLDMVKWYADHTSLGTPSPLKTTYEHPWPRNRWCMHCLYRVRELASDVGLI